MPHAKVARVPKTYLICRICKQAKPEQAYSPLVWATSVNRGKCRDCFQSYNATRYVSGQGDRMEKSRQERMAMVHRIKAERGCKECGEKHPACLDFHHRDKAAKIKAVGTLVQTTYSIDNILKEIAKCDVLCSNCHRKHHWNTKTVGRPKSVR